MLHLKTAALLTALLLAQNARAEEEPSLKKPATAPMAEADNTAVNKRDQSDGTLTPMDQAKGSKHDVEFTRRIRQLIIKDKAMSSDAKNVKIITLSGRTTLRGPVDSMAEKDRIAGHAAKVLGSAANIDNQLESKTANE